MIRIVLKGEEGTLFPRNMVLYTVSVSTVILGDPIYLLLPWLMKLYPNIRDPGKRESRYKLTEEWAQRACLVG